MNVGRLRLAIPKAPRAVTYTQIPGAVRRLVISMVVALVACAGLGVLSLRAGRWFSTEREFFSSAEEVQARISEIKLPTDGKSDAKVTVLYPYAGLDRSVSGVPMLVDDARETGPGMKVTVLVNPRAPEKARELRHAEATSGFTRFFPFGLGLGLIVAVLLVARELRRAFRRELDPLKKGMLVWLTPDQDLPRTRGELQFKAHYFQDDKKYEVWARARPGRAPVRNGEKLLAAVVPSQPTWVRVVDEDIAKVLGWYQLS
jgi:Protein of unknown function (DUF3592)